MKFAQTMFMAEEEGLLPTRRGTLNAIALDVKTHPAREIDINDFEAILNKYNLTFSDLTQKEIKYINMRIS